MSSTILLPPREKLCIRYCSNKHTHDGQTSPPRSLVRDGQTSPHRPRLVVSHSTCLPLSPPPPQANSFVISPYANSFVIYIGTAVINTHRYCSNEQTHVLHCPPPPREQLCNRYCRNKTHCSFTPPWVGSRSPDGWEQIPRWAGGWVLHQPPWSFGFDSQTRGTTENRAPPCVKVPGSSRVPFFPPSFFHTISLSPAFTSA
jgi:hypothetical protein